VIPRGAFLHDIGKMAIPDAILRKPGPLSSEEFMRMQEHCYHGYHLLKKIPFLEEAAKIVYAHHERYDGTGYPRRLKGEEIPLGARFVAVANTLGAVTSDQPYRKARSLAEAREEIERWSGRQFDPDVVRAFLSMPDKIWQDLSREIAVTHESV
jgi:putative nucleotidyltransferase with HDIG domain